MILLDVIAGVHAAQVRLTDDARTASQHLLEQNTTLHSAHEDQNLDRLDVCTRGDHVHSHSNTREISVAEITDELLGILHLIGDLLAELIALAEHLTCNMDDVLRVAVILGKDQRLGHFAPARKQIDWQTIFECLKNCAYLIWRNYRAVELFRVIGKVLVEQFHALSARDLIALANPF